MSTFLVREKLSKLEYRSIASINIGLKVKEIRAKRKFSEIFDIPYLKIVLIETKTLAVLRGEFWTIEKL